MANSVIKLTGAGVDTGPFNLFSNVDSFAVAFETGVSKADLLSGYYTFIPIGATTVRVKSASVLCTNSVDMGITTTSTTTESPSTTKYYTATPCNSSYNTETFSTTSLLDETKVIFTNSFANGGSEVCFTVLRNYFPGASTALGTYTVFNDCAACAATNVATITYAISDGGSTFSECQGAQSQYYNEYYETLTVTFKDSNGTPVTPTGTVQWNLNGSVFTTITPGTTFVIPSQLNWYDSSVCPGGGPYADVVQIKINGVVYLTYTAGTP
jgi:hypothetical protein